MPKENARPEPFHSWFSDIERPNKVEKMSFEKTSAFQLLKIQALCGLLQRHNKNKNLERTNETVTYGAKMLIPIPKIDHDLSTVNEFQVV